MKKITKTYNRVLELLRKIIFFNKERKERQFPAKDNHEILETFDTSRRELIKTMAVIPVFGTLFFGMAKKGDRISFEEKILADKTETFHGTAFLPGQTQKITDLKGQVPAGKIKDIKFSRIMLGGNLISGFAHSRDLIYVSSLVKRYFTDEKIIETLWLCEECGINTAVLRCDENVIRVLEKYRSQGGKIQWLAQTYPKGDDLTNVKLAVDHGAIGAFVQGGIADKLVYDKKYDDLKKPIEFIQKQGLIAGTAAHSIMVPRACASNGIYPDFFMKTFHSNKYWSATQTDPADPELPKDGNDHSMAHDNIWCMSDTATADFFKDNPTPWIAYKVLAAGALKPEAGFRHAFTGGADFACIGMFDFQVVENANIACNILSGEIRRERKWYS